MKILAFGQIADITQQTQWEIDSQSDIAALQNWLHESFPAMASMTYLIAVNQQIVKENIALKESDVIALLPPFSGG